MNDKEVLEKAIQKAIDSGFLPDITMDDMGKWLVEVVPTGKWIRFHNSGLGYSATTHDWSVNDLIYNHDFARTLWGEDAYVYGHEYHAGQEVQYRSAQAKWQYHLQQMVIADDPVKYLMEHL